MRVIAGQVKGQKLKSKTGRKARPTTDRVKEALFNMFGSEIVDIDVLDLYAGFGGLGIEALSRGARSVAFIEKVGSHIEIIKENLENTGLDERAEVIQGDVLKEIGRFNPKSFDIILMDPPYWEGLIMPTINKILKLGLLKRAGIIAVEHHKNDEIKVEFSDLNLIRRRDYGNTRLNLYMKVEKGEV